MTPSLICFGLDRVGVYLILSSALLMLYEGDQFFAIEWLVTLTVKKERIIYLFIVIKVSDRKPSLLISKSEIARVDSILVGAELKFRDFSNELLIEITPFQLLGGQKAKVK